MGRIKVSKAPIEGLYLVEPVVHGDSRGFFHRRFQGLLLAAAGADGEAVGHLGIAVFTFFHTFLFLPVLPGKSKILVAIQ